MANDFLIKHVGGRTRAYPLSAIRVKSHLGAGELRYLTSDGYCGVAIDGDRTVDDRPRVDEIHVEHLALT